MFLIGVIVVAGVAIVVIIALVAVGMAVGRGQREPTAIVYVLPEAVEYVAARLPDEVTSRVGYDDVRTVLEWHLDWLTAIFPTTDNGTGGPSDSAVDDSATVDTDAAVAAVVVEADSAIDAVVARAMEAGGPDPVDVVCMMSVHHDYLLETGVITV